jgi:hypothetical protein
MSLHQDLDYFLEVTGVVLIEKAIAQIKFNIPNQVSGIESSRTVSRQYKAKAGLIKLRINLCKVFSELRQWSLLHP